MILSVALQNLLLKRLPKCLTSLCQDNSLRLIKTCSETLTSYPYLIQMVFLIVEYNIVIYRKLIIYIYLSYDCMHTH